jgi:myo-inositol-1-phosphate synthase
MNNKSSHKVSDFIKLQATLACACVESKNLKSLKTLDKRSEYNKNYYQKHREEIIKKHLEYYHENKEMINTRNKDYYVNYYQHNKQRILTRVQNNYYNKIHAIKVYKPPIIQKQNEILGSNIIIRLMD